MRGPLAGGVLSPSSSDFNADRSGSGGPAEAGTWPDMSVMIKKAPKISVEVREEIEEGELTGVV